MSESSAADDRDLALATSLRGLGLLAPRRSAWPELARALAVAAPAAAPRPRYRRRLWQFAAAASAVTVALLLWQPPPAPRVGLDPARSVSTQANALMQESERWERTLRQLEPYSGAVDARSALISAEIEDLIGMTDLQLGAASDPGQMAALWQRRIGLLRRLAEIRTDAAWQQAQPDQQLSMSQFNPTLL
ncbi:MAG: hypothetical protein COS34_12850 [Lysobacterales bacterium CG02_land_8_20_14_3_00_62_12]|nr:MAG: hypothetical protein COS34_12850 [Xanthomonadales bacterium CG02_land_8_20_14_3_00_62_12]